ncbi:hypothetical protein BR93DRAFT_925761 [Coniochaeta sp. PMI_546]|nr:hypothetical protein BR93DRAFT_925761 [Coniochaeta sp. PMI_546]
MGWLSKSAPHSLQCVCCLISGALFVGCTFLHTEKEVGFKRSLKCSDFGSFRGTCVYPVR